MNSFSKSGSEADDLYQDKIFENAVYDDWGTITGPRVQGAWNLHELLPSNLDFFILLGSFLGDTGNAGQSIYASTAVSEYR